MKFEDIIKLLELFHAAGKQKIWELAIEFKARRKPIWDINADECVRDYETDLKDRVPKDAFNITYILRDGSDGYREMEITEEQYDILNELINMQKEDFNFLKEENKENE